MNRVAVKCFCGLVTLVVILLMQTHALPATPWSGYAEIPENGFHNPLKFSKPDLEKSKTRGAFYILNYPFEQTGATIPYDFSSYVDRTLEANPVLKVLPYFKSLDDWQDWLGLEPYGLKNKFYPEWLNHQLPEGEHQKLGLRMGASLVNTPFGPGVTFSCANCHSSNLFGKQVIGLTNRFSRAYDFFRLGKLFLKSGFISKAIRIHPSFDEQNARHFERLEKSVEDNRINQPQALGLDTSISSIADTLTESPKFKHLVADEFNLVAAEERKIKKSKKTIADSKPMPLWNVRYKNRFLSDGSLVSGNPILTNFLWNEILRGGDLDELNKWFDNNPDIIDDITNYIYELEAPKYIDFFPNRQVNLADAKSGHKLFEQRCSSCHGSYVKGWDLGEESFSYRQKLETVSYIPPKKTFVATVGTDPSRFLGTAKLAKLNKLEISKNNNIRVQFTGGYVPPPLEGIWARWPYLHNNSIPNICVLFEAPENRPKKFYGGPAIDPDKDFDHDCLGYPLGEAVPEGWKKISDYYFDTTKPGLSNSGHSEGIFFEDGHPLFNDQEKKQLIEFLKTL